METESALAYTVLTQGLAEEYWSRMATLDRAAVELRQLDYWGRENFLYGALHKWQLSAFVRVNEYVVGYRIASGLGKIENYAHSHRTSIARDFRMKGIGSELLSMAIGSARRLGYCGMTGLRHPDNHSSLMFLRKTGWMFSGNYINGNELWYVNF